MSNLDLPLQACTEVLNVSKITVRRDGRRATFDNSERTAVRRIDLDCLFPFADVLKSDYLVSKPGTADVIVELKGKDIGHAVEQIISTFVMWRKTPPFSDKIGGLIVLTRCPMRAAEIGDIKKRLLVKHGLWMEIDKDQKSEYRFETFAGKRA